MPLAVQNGGYFVPNFPSLKGSDLNSNSRVPVDANPTSAQSSARQSGGIIPGTQVCPAPQVGVIAKAGGGQATATQLGYGVNQVATVATAADSVKLPPAFPGAMVYVRNDGANSTTVFGSGTDTIDAVASATGNAQAAAKGKLYFGTGGDADGVAGTWVTLLGA